MGSIPSRPKTAPLCQLRGSRVARWRLEFCDAPQFGGVRWADGNSPLHDSVLLPYMAHREPSASERRRTSISAALLGASGVMLAVIGFAPWACRFSDPGDARVVWGAVRQWQTTETSRACPTYADLIRSGLLEPAGARDGGSDFWIRCSPCDISVVWAGTDRQFGTLDDQTVPDPSAIQSRWSSLRSALLHRWPSWRRCS